jgi:cell division septation protein DedD
MFWRLLLLLLIALNLGLAGWLVFGQAPHTMPPASDPGVPELKLLPGQATTSATVMPGAIKASGQCLRIGPFATQSAMRKAFHVLAPKVAQIQFHQRAVTRATGWWVYLPALPTLDKALARAQALDDAGIKDYYLVTAGGRRNTVSLGVFHDQDNARRLLARARNLGFRARLRQRHETVPQYWLDVALPAEQSFDWRAGIEAPSVAARPIDCF